MTSAETCQPDLSAPEVLSYAVTLNILELIRALARTAEVLSVQDPNRKH